MPKSITRAVDVYIILLNRFVQNSPIEVTEQTCMYKVLLLPLTEQTCMYKVLLLL